MEGNLGRSTNAHESVSNGKRILVSAAGEQLLTVYPDLLDSLSRWIAESKYRVPSAHILPGDFVVRSMPWGDQSHPRRLDIQSGEAAGAYVFKERVPSDISQPYINEMQQTIQMWDDLRPVFSTLGVRLQDFFFATDDLCLVRFAEGETPTWRQAEPERIVTLHNVVFDYLSQKRDDPLWKDVHPHALDAFRRPHYKDFVLEEDGKTLVWVDPFVYATDPDRKNFYPYRVDS